MHNASADILPGYDPRPHWQTRLKEHFLTLSLLLIPSKTRANVFYDLISTKNLMNEESLYLNMGYWKASPKTLDAACEAMAQMLAEAADLTHADRVLDVGFGFGDQDLFWMKRFAPKQIVGLNVTRLQVDHARRRIAARGLSDRVDLRLGSATAMPLQAESFDKVLALECAIHFHTRERFFHEAYRVLRPGGRIALTDMPTFPRAGQLSRKLELALYLARSITQICKENMYDRHTLRDKLIGAGFENVEVASIYELVGIPYAQYILKRLADPAVSRRYYPLQRLMWLQTAKMILSGEARQAGLDYVLAVGNKPQRRAEGS